MALHSFAFAPLCGANPTRKYNHFKTIDDIKNVFNVKIIVGTELFSQIVSLSPSRLLVEILADNIPLALNINTEKACSEFIWGF